MMGDIRFEKCIEALYEHTATTLPAESREKCPLLNCLAEVLITVKEANNKEILDELGMLPCSNFTCECRTVRKYHLEGTIGC